jgi:hypothetical protein
MSSPADVVSPVYSGGNKAVGASETYTQVSRNFPARNLWGLRIDIKLFDITDVNASTVFYVMQTPDNGESWLPLGSTGQVSVVAKEVAHTDVDTGTDTITETSHGFTTGQSVIYNADTGSVTGLTSGTTYFIISASANTFKLATSYANAIAGTAIDLTATTAGNVYFYKKILTIVAEIENDANMPMASILHVAVSTGAGDSIKVDRILHHLGSGPRLAVR